MNLNDIKKINIANLFKKISGLFASTKGVHYTPTQVWQLLLLMSVLVFLGFGANAITLFFSSEVSQTVIDEEQIQTINRSELQKTIDGLKARESEFVTVIKSGTVVVDPSR